MKLGHVGRCWAAPRAAFAMLLALLGASSTAAKDRPHMVFLLADDMRFDAIGAHGNRVIRTPNLDRLVREGMTFTRAIAANPICTPSRAEMLTGCSGFRCGVTFFGQAMDPKLPTLAATLRAAGYHTAYIGKWHNDGSPVERGYTEARRVFRGGMGPHEMTFVEDGVPHRGYSSQLFADAAVDFLARPHSQPFFLHVAFTAPHDPRTPPADDAFRYDPAAIALPKNFLPEHPFDNGELQVRDEKLLPWPRTPDAIRRELAAYYAMITHLDLQVGRILQALADRGLERQTLVVFASDHGLALGSHGLLGKQSLYDHSVGAPLIVWGPGVPKGVDCRAQVYLRDLFPTFCDVAGVPIPDGVQGKSLAPLFRNPNATHHPFVVGYYRDVQRMIRTDRWKLIVYPKIGKIQLFDLKRDPDECQDVSADPTHAARIAELTKLLRQWQQEHGDPLAATTFDRRGASL